MHNEPSQKKAAFRLRSGLIKQKIANEMIIY